MIDVISIGSSVVDIFITAKNIKLSQQAEGLILAGQIGEKIDVDGFEVCTGGGGSNTAVGFARLGFNAAVISELGTDAWAQVILQDFKKESVDDTFLIKEKKEQTGGSVILSSMTDGRMIMVYRGAGSMLDPHDVPAHALQNTHWLHLSSIAGREATLQKIFSITAQTHQPFSWNPGQDEIALIIQGKLNLEGLSCALLFVNMHEWELLKTKQDNLFNFASNIVVTNGKAGGKVWQNGKVFCDYQSQPVLAVNETGAGDSFAVGVAAGLLKGMQLRESLEIGIKNSASVVSQIGAKRGLLQERDVF